MATSSSPAESRGTVAVLGSARLGADDPRHAAGVVLGSRLAEAGWTVMTGGYAGLMAAVAEGAARAGGHVIGLPMAHWSTLTPSEHHHELRWCANYPERLAHLLGCDAVVALDGGIGTMSEAFVVWAARQTEPDAPTLIVSGDGWPHLLDIVRAEMVVDAVDLAHVLTAETPEQVLVALETAAQHDRTPLHYG